MRDAGAGKDSKFEPRPLPPASSIMPTDFLQLAGKRILVMGVANRKSVAWHVARVLVEAGAEVVYAVRNEVRREQVRSLVGDAPLYVCDVEFEDQIERLAGELSEKFERLDGFLHSIAFADYSDEPRPFHETSKRDFLRAFDISCFSLVAVSNSLKDLLSKDASVVTISISTTTMASENYGYMAPIKAALDSSLAFLAKSFSRFSQVRFNAVAPGLLKTSASAGIPGYVDSYLYAEQATLRKKAVQTEEVANVAAFLLSPRSGGINSQRIVVDAGMSTNYFDATLIKAALER
jgi:enoyl-[acyl-carrier protein] reductase I